MSDKAFLESVIEDFNGGYDESMWRGSISQWIRC